MPWRADRATVAVVLAALALPLGLAGCAGRPSIGTARPFAYTGYDATGLASWYGKEMGGNRTASGRRFDPSHITAAHRTLPLGQVVEVTALDTGRAALVLIDDRGPHRADRLLDLSQGAARLLGADRRSVASVRVRSVTAAAADLAALRAGKAVVIRRGRVPAAVSAVAPGRYLLQIASFASRDRAAALADRLGAELVPGNGLWRVRLGPFDARGAQRARDAVAAQGYGDAVLFPLDP
jgi:rare lipoprotein A